MSKTRPVVERMCCTCRRRSPRGELIRIVAYEGNVRVDEKGNAPGRGVYLHRQGACVGRSVERATIERSLHLSQGSVSDDQWREVISALGRCRNEKNDQVSRGSFRLRLRGGS